MSGKKKRGFSIKKERKPVKKRRGEKKTTIVVRKKNPQDTAFLFSFVFHFKWETYHNLTERKPRVNRLSRW